MAGLTSTGWVGPSVLVAHNERFACHITGCNDHVTGAVDAQVSGVAVATAGFVLATRWFQVPYNEVQYGHGKLGMAIVVIVYLQVSCDKWDQVPHDVHLIAS